MTCYLCNKTPGSLLCNYCKSQFPFYDLDDNAFKIVLYEFQHGTISYDSDQLDSLFFNPILDQHSCLSDPNNDLDPDLNIQNVAKFCNYETAEDLNGVIDGSSSISFSLLHLNAPSLVKNQEALSHLLINVNHKFSVLAITETWIKENNVHDIRFDGYNFVSNHRTNKTGGGVGLFIDQRFSYKILPQFNVSDANIIESLFVEICIPRHKNIIIGVIYRPPSETTLEFVEKINEIISGVTKGKKHCYITGDFNLDLLKHESHPITAQFIESLFAFGFLPMITKPTRITAHSATLIDNIFTNNTTVSSKNGLIISDISDHLPIYSLVCGDSCLRKDSDKYITVRDTSERRVNEFRHKLENTNWDIFDQATDVNDPNTAYNIFIEKFTGLFDTCFPFKTIKGKALNSFRKPWLTKGLLRSINRKNSLYKQYLCCRTSEQFLKYKMYKNKLTSLLRVAKRLYFQTQIELNMTNIKQTWRILNKAIGQNKKKEIVVPVNR